MINSTSPSSTTMDERMQSGRPVLNEAPDLTNLSKDPAILREQLRQLEEDVQALSVVPKKIPGDTKAQDIAEKGMTDEERKTERSLREELANTSRELSRLQRDSIADDLQTRGIPPTMEAYEQKYREAKDRAIEAEKDKVRALEALQSLVGGKDALKDIVVSAKLEHAKRAGSPSSPKRMSIDDYRPKYDGLNLSTARGGELTPLTPGSAAAPPASSLQQIRERAVARAVLEESLPIGMNTIPMFDAEGKGFKIGQKVIIGTGQFAEERYVVGFGSLVLDRPLQYSHGPGEIILGINPTTATNALTTSPERKQAQQDDRVSNPWGDDSLVLATQTNQLPGFQPPPPKHAITDEIDDDVPPPPPPEDPFWQRRMDADRVRERERMRKWKSIETKPAAHQRDWNQSDAVSVQFTRERRRGGYGRRQKYREEHRNRVRRVVKEDNDSRRGRGHSSSSPTSTRDGDRDRKTEHYPLRDGTLITYDSDDGSGDPNDLLSSGRVGRGRARSDLYSDLHESRERHHAARRKEREIGLWAKQLASLTKEERGAGADGDDSEGDELMNILRETQGGDIDDDSLYDDDEDSIFGGDAAMLLDNRVRNHSSPRSATRNARGRRTKTLSDGRVVKDLRSPTQYGNYANASRYGATGRKYRSRMDSYHRASSYEYQRGAATSRVDDRVAASRSERNRKKETQGDRREAARLMREREENLDARERRRNGRGHGQRSKSSPRRQRHRDGESEYSSPSINGSKSSNIGRVSPSSKYMVQKAGEDVFDALRAVIAHRIRNYGHTEDDTRGPLLALDDDDTGLLNMDDIAFALRRIGARLTEAHLNEIFELLGEDQSDPDSADDIVYEDLVVAMHRDDHLVDRTSQPEQTSSITPPAGPTPSQASGPDATSGPAAPAGPPPLAALAKLATAPEPDRRPIPRGPPSSGGNSAAPGGAPPPPPPPDKGARVAHNRKAQPRGARPPPPKPAAKQIGGGNPSVFSRLDESVDVVSRLKPKASMTHARDSYGMTRTELSVSIDGLRTRKRLMAVVEVGFPASSPAPEQTNGTMSAQQIRQRDRAASLHTQGHGRNSIQWYDENKKTFTGQSLVDWLIDDLNVPGVHDAVLEAQSLVEGGWILMAGAPPVADTPSAQGRVGDTFNLQSIYTSLAMRWVEIGRTEPRRGPSCGFTTTTSLMFALPNSPQGGGADGIVLTTTVFAIDEDAGGSGQPRAASSSVDSDIDLKRVDAKGTSVVAVGTVALSDLLSSPGGWLVGPRQHNYPIKLLASSPSNFGLSAPPPDAHQKTSMQSYVFNTSDVVRSNGAKGMLNVTEMISEVSIGANVAPQLLALYRERIQSIVRSFDNGNSSEGLESQRELASTYRAFSSDYDNSLMTAQSGQSRESEQLAHSFKAARLVSDISRQFDATNIHVHTLHVEDNTTGLASSYPTLSMGMPAAHPLGFSRGGLLRLQEEYMTLRRSIVASGKSIDVDDMKRMESLGIEIDKRKDIVLSQCTTALVASFLATAETYRPGKSSMADPIATDWWSSTTRAGFLLHFEGVLNNSKKDQCILEDFVVGARALEKMFICIVDRPSTNSASFNARANSSAPTVEIHHVNAAQGASAGGHLQVDLYMGDMYPFSRLPEAVQRGALIPVRTTVFSHSPTLQPSSNVSNLFV